MTKEEVTVFVILWYDSDLSGMEPYRKAAMVKVGILGSICAAMGSAMACNGRGVGSLHILGAIFPISTTPPPDYSSIEVVKACASCG